MTRGSNDDFDDFDDAIARALRGALTREAAMVHPSDDSLDRIREQVDQQRPNRWLPVLAAAAAVAVVATAAVLLTRDGEEPIPPAAGGSSSTTQPAPTSTTEPSASPEPSPTPSATETSPGPGGESAVPVYWVGESGSTRLWLYREFRQGSGPDAVTAALTSMLCEDPADPDYTNPWSCADVSVAVDGDAITVDVGSAAFAAGAGSELAAIAVQQLVWTATAAAQTNGGVSVLVDGEPGYDAWGTVTLGEPMRRDNDTRAQIWVLEPTQGGEVAGGTVTISGESTAFEATVLYEVTDPAGTVVTEGFTMGGANGDFAPFSVDVELAPGDYTVTVYAPDASDGESAEGPRMFLDDKDVTVTG